MKVTEANVFLRISIKVLRLNIITLTVLKLLSRPFAEAFTLNIQNTTKTKVFHTFFSDTTYAPRFKVD